MVLKNRTCTKNRMTIYKRFWTVFTVVYFLDLATKHWVVQHAQSLRSDPIVLIDGISGLDALLEITYVTNPGAAWSMLSDYPEFLTVLAGIALISIYIFRTQLELKSNPQQFIFGSICGGIAGNLTDRLFREPAEVVDFIDVYLPLVEYDYPVFNIADSGIFVGAFFYFFWSILEVKNEKAKEIPVSN